MIKNERRASLFRSFNKVFYTTGAYDHYLETFKGEGLDYALRIAKELKPTPFWHFLDAGCGMGGIVSGLRKLGFEAWGTEVSPFCLKFSPAKKWMRFGDLRNLPFPDKCFEVAICTDVLYYLTKIESRQAIKELTRVAKYYLYIETICKNSPNSSQQFNPDPLRKDGDLLTVKEMKSLFKANQAVFLKPLFPQEEMDFNGVFIKRDRKNRLELPRNFGPVAQW